VNKKNQGDSNNREHAEGGFLPVPCFRLPHRKQLASHPQKREPATNTAQVKK
jgi:hypothetical protein